jgi:hypothetical protein
MRRTFLGQMLPIQIVPSALGPQCTDLNPTNKEEISLNTIKLEGSRSANPIKSQMPELPF